MKKRVRKISRIFIVLLAFAAVLSFTSCSVIDDFQRVGLRGWLNTGVKKGVSSTAQPTSSAQPPASDAVNDTPILTKLPVIPEIPDMQELISSLDPELPDDRSIVIYISGTPNVYRYYGESVEKQDDLIWDTFDLRVISHNDSAESIEKKLSDAEYFADLLYIPLSTAVSFAKNDLLVPITEGQTYGNEELFDITNRGGDKDYYVVPSFSVPYESNIVIFCNTELLATIGQFTDITQSAAKGSFDVKMFSSMLDIKSLPEGVHTLVSQFDGEKLERIFASVNKYSESGITEKVLKVLDENVGEDALSEFYKGNSLFMIAEVSDIRKLYDSYDSYAILPMPKANFSDREYPAIFDSDSLYVYAIPKNAANASLAKAYIKMRSFISKYQFRYEFADSLYSYYLRQGSSTQFIGESLFSGLCDIEFDPDDSEVPSDTESVN